MSNIILSSSVLAQFPSTRVGVVIVRGLSASAFVSSHESIKQKLALVQDEISSRFSLDTLSTDEKIKCWRDAYKAFGVKSGEARSSNEALIRRVLNGKRVDSINFLVDVYNYISFKYAIPVGGEDLQKVSGDILLTMANNEPVVQLLGSDAPEAPRNGEVIYKDAVSAICRRWNWREAARTALTPQTTDAIIVVDSLLASDSLDEIIGEICELLGGGISQNIQSTILDKNTVSFSF
jgi:DNA/RNA-binding domain of Phe-tRNA-synthetase-like protein